MITAALFAVVAGSMVTGCAPYQYSSNHNFGDRIFSGWRDYVWAKRAYHLRFATCEARHPTHFRRGFIAGYSAISNGSDGYTPVVPPRDYWGYAYQTAEGQEMIENWFAGYPHGVEAAREDGVGAYRDVQVSRLIQAAMQPNQPTWMGEAELADPNLNVEMEVIPNPETRPAIEMQQPVELLPEKAIPAQVQPPVSQLPRESFEIPLSDQQPLSFPVPSTETAPVTVQPPFSFRGTSQREPAAFQSAPAQPQPIQRSW